MDNSRGKNNTDIYILIARFLGGNTTPEETDILRDWIEQSPENKKLFFEQQDLWEALNPTFDITEGDIEKAKQRILVKTGIMPKEVGFIKRIFTFWSRIAAIAILPMLAITIYFIIDSHNTVNEDVSLSTDYGCSSKATLPDGTIVWLNANSRLEYCQNMNRDTRDVNLHGEAYFEVYADKKRPFTVHTADINVTATGTEFNVNAYDSNVSVTLTEGKVEVDNTEHKVSMVPGEHLTVQNGEMNVTKAVDTNLYCSWRNGILIFENEQINSICRRLQQIYNVEFDVDPRLSNRTFRFILKGESISEVLNLFQMTAPIICSIENDSSLTDSINTPLKIRIRPI